jgi:hypothetical protein
MYRDLQEIKGHLAKEDHRALLGYLDLEVILENLGQKVAGVILVCPGLKDPKESKVNEDLKELEVPRGHQVKQETTVTKGLPARPVSLVPTA